MALELLDVLRRVLERSPAARGMGITVKQAAAGQAQLELIVVEGMINGMGVCQGGYLFALADIAGAYACLTRGVDAFTHTANITYVTSARLGEHLLARAFEVTRSGRSAVYDVVVANAAGRTVALWRGTFRLVGHPHTEKETT